MLSQLKKTSLGRALWRLLRGIKRQGKRLIRLAAPLYEWVPSPAHLRAANRHHNKQQQRILAAFEAGDHTGS